MNRMRRFLNPPRSSHTIHFCIITWLLFCDPYAVEFFIAKRDITLDNFAVRKANRTGLRFTSMSVLPRGYECCRAPPRYGCVRGEYSIYYKRPRCGQPRPQPFQRECACYCCGGPSNAPVERPCCYDFPCKAHCFNHGACTRPSGRYARTVWYPGECCPCVPPCQAFTCPNPPYHPCCYHTCNKHV